MSQFRNPFFCTVSCQRFKSSMGLLASFVHLSAAFVMVSVLVNPKVITSFTPSPIMGIDPVKMVWAHINSSRRVICSRSSMKSCAIFSTALCAGVFPEYIFSPMRRFSKSSIVVTFSGATSGGVYVLVIYPVLGTTLPPISRDTYGATLRLPFLKSTSTLSVTNVSSCRKNVLLKNVLTGGSFSMTLPIVLGS